MPGCAVTGCNNYSRKTAGTNIQHFRFPKNEELCKRWIHACRREDKLNLKEARICSAHFEITCFEISMQQRLMNKENPKSHLKAHSIPTLYLPGKRHRTLNDEERSKRLAKRRRLDNVNVDEILHASSIVTQSTSSTCVCEDKENSVVEKLDKSVEERLSVLQNENRTLLLKIKEIEQKQKKTEEMLSNIFTPGQVKKLLDPDNKRVRWNPEDIASAISLPSVSPKGYRYLRAKGYPYPALSTLRKWASTFSVDQGILDDVIMLMKTASHNMTENERLCVLSFDEIYLSNRVDIDKKKQQKIGPHKTCQTVIARGLIGKWKQPVFYDFDKPMTKEILYEIISKLYEAGFTVVALVSDMGSTNTALWTNLNVGYDKNCYFHHPSDDALKIFVFADVPHLIKLLRNHLLDNGLWIKDTLIDRTCFEKLLHISITELTLAHKISKYHLDVKGSQRQKVRPAVQLLSNSVAKAIEYCGLNGMMPTNVSWKEAAAFVKLMNDWFDLFNSRSKLQANYPTKNAFGTDLQNQKRFLEELTESMKNMRVGKKQTLIPFQKGIILSSRSLGDMYDYISVTYNIEYILTSRLNQDVVENFFSYVRGMGATNDHPHPLDFKYRLRWFILGKNSDAVFTENTNTEEQGENCLVKPFESNQHDSTTVVPDDCPLTKRLLENITQHLDTVEQDNSPMEEEEMLLPYSFIEPIYPDLLLPETDAFIDNLDLLVQYESKEKIYDEALKYIAGYVAHKFRNKYNNLGTRTDSINVAPTNLPDWIHFISRGGLLEPSVALMQVAQIMEKEFYSMHGTSLSNETQIFKLLADRTVSKAHENDIPYEVIYCLARTRTYIRLRSINQQISFQNCKRKLEKKMSKFTNYKN